MTDADKVKRLPTFPLSDNQILGAAIAQLTVMDMQELVEEFKRHLRASARQIGVFSLALKAFSDLFLEVTEHHEHRKWLARHMLRVEREAARLRLPSWVWRIDSGGNVPEQLAHRARFLREEVKAHPDDIWDTLSEVLKSADIEVDENMLRSAMGGGSHANS
jgi:hypothetical protein